MFYWDPRPEAFEIPYLGWPIFWYGVLFALGFALGFPVFVSVLRRFFFHAPEYVDSDLLHPENMKDIARFPRAIVDALNAKIHAGESVSISARQKKMVDLARVAFPYRAYTRLFLDDFWKGSVLGVFRKATLITDKLVVYVLIATVIGARLGHILFYENISEYFSHPALIFHLRKGGLASHGAAFAILVALFFFYRKIRHMAPKMTWLRLIDFISIPTALCAVFIRLGNFVNQEILGKPTSLPWGVVFGHPKDLSGVVARHPVQIYEALVYLFVFWVLWRLTYQVRFFLTPGKIGGLFLILVFGFRFLIEFLKMEQSEMMPYSSFFTMGQILSIPMILLGIFIYAQTLQKLCGNWVRK